MATTASVALLGYGERLANAPDNLFERLAEAFAARAIAAKQVSFRHDLADRVRRDLDGFDAVLAWVNPLEEGCARTALDDILRDLAAGGVMVGAHPNVIAKLGTKEVLYHTRFMAWGADTRRHFTLEELEQALRRELREGSRVLKFARGNGGNGVWRVAPWSFDDPADPMIRVMKAERAYRDNTMRLSRWMMDLSAELSARGPLIDQPFYSPVPAGMVRCYLTRDRVAGFGYQQVASLLWEENGQTPPPHLPRVYASESDPRFSELKSLMETRWIGEMQRILDIAATDLPVLWDADFLVRAHPEPGREPWVLCEINASSVSPFPDSAIEPMVQTVADALSSR